MTTVVGGGAAMISRILALLSLVVFTGCLITPLRIRRFARWSQGLARLFRLHHNLGLIAAFLIVSHVSWELYSAPWPGPQSLLFTQDPALIVAWISVLMFGLALVFSLSSKLRYRTWYGLHMMFPLSFLLAFFHAYQFRFMETWDEAAIIMMGASGILIMISIIIHNYWNPTATTLLVKDVRKLSASSWELVLQLEQPEAKARTFRAGDIVYTRFLHEGFTRSLHPFSVASCRFEPDLRLYIKNLGRDTSHLQDLSMGSPIQVIGPFSELRPDASRAQIWVAGGIGIAPFLGFRHCMDFERWSHPVDLIYYAKADQENDLEMDSLFGASGSSNPLKITTVLTRNNTLDFTPLDISIGELEEPLILVCGPPPFMRAVRRHILQMGIPGHRIHTEEFAL